MANAGTAFFQFKISTIVRASIVFPALRAAVSATLAVAPGWLARTAARHFVTPPQHGYTNSEILALKNARHRQVASPMGKLAVWQFGDQWRPVVVFSHGWGGRGAQFREFVPALVGAGFQVWLFDHVGHGLSDGREAPITDFAKGIASVVRAAEEEGVTVAGLIGHSLGAVGVGIALRDELLTHEHLRVVQIAPPASLIRYSHFFALRFGLPESVRAAIQWRLEQKIGRSWQEFELPAAVAQLRSKALVIHDDKDREVAIEDGLAVARAWPDARFKRTEGLGHKKLLRDQQVIDAAVDFIADRAVFSLPPPGDESSAPWPARLY